MDSIIDSLVLPDLTVLLTIVVMVTVGIIQMIRMILCKYVKGSWTQRIPGWVWLALSIVIPMGIVYLFKLDWIEALINSALPPSVTDINLPGYGTIGTGIVAAFSSKGAYALVKKAGLTADYSPGGLNDITPPAADSVNPPIDNVPPVPMELPAPIPDPGPFPQVETPTIEETDYITGPSERCPNHVMVPRGWLAEQTQQPVVRLVKFIATPYIDAVLIEGDSQLVLPVTRDLSAGGRDPAPYSIRGDCPASSTPPQVGQSL